MWGQSYYEFKEPKIRMLSSALMSIKNTLNAKAVELHSDISLKEVKRWKRYAVLTDDSEAFDITMKYEPKMAAVISVESDNICDWFSIILEMVEQLKDLSEIKEVSNRYINDDRMAQSLRYFTGLKKNMWRELDQLWLERNCKQIEGQLTEVTNKP